MTLITEVEEANDASDGLGLSVAGVKDGVMSSGAGVADDGYTTNGIVLSSFCVEDGPSSVAWVKDSKGVNVEDVSTGTEEESSQDGVTGMTVNMPTSCSAGDEVILAGAVSDETATVVEAKERAIGPAEQAHANVRTMVERWKNISAFGICLQLCNEREDDRQDKTTGQNGKENSVSNGDLCSAASD